MDRREYCSSSILCYISLLSNQENSKNKGVAFVLLSIGNKDNNKKEILLVTPAHNTSLRLRCFTSRSHKHATTTTVVMPFSTGAHRSAGRLHVRSFGPGYEVILLRKKENKAIFFETQGL
jgi:hypothetical protein